MIVLHADSVAFSVALDEKKIKCELFLGNLCIMYFEELKLAVSLAVLPSTESLKIAHCSLLITVHYYGQEKNYNVVFIS